MRAKAPPVPGFALSGYGIGNAVDVSCFRGSDIPLRALSEKEHPMRILMCPMCGGSLAHGINFCPHCGFKLAGHSINTPTSIIVPGNVTVAKLTIRSMVTSPVVNGRMRSWPPSGECNILFALEDINTGRTYEQTISGGIDFWVYVTSGTHSGYKTEYYKLRDELVRKMMNVLIGLLNEGWSVQETINYYATKEEWKNLRATENLNSSYEQWENKVVYRKHL